MDASITLKILCDKICKLKNFDCKGGELAMKHQNWDVCPENKKWRAVAEEVRIDTHNGTTKADLLNTWSGYLEDLIGFRYCKDCGCFDGIKGCIPFDIRVNPRRDGCTFWTDKG